MPTTSTPPPPPPSAHMSPGGAITTVLSLLAAAAGAVHFVGLLGAIVVTVAVTALVFLVAALTGIDPGTAGRYAGDIVLRLIDLIRRR